MPNLGPTELIIIALVIILLFGWKRLPDAARSLGRSARVFKSEVSEMKAEDEARKRADDTKATGTTTTGTSTTGSAGSTTVEGSALREDNSPRTDNQSGHTH